MPQKVSRRTGLKLLAAIAGGAVAARDRGDDVSELLPTGGAGREPVAASSYDPLFYIADSRPVDAESVVTPAVVFVTGSNPGVVEVS